MTIDAIVAPRWSTSSFADGADVSANELSALGRHLSLCRGLQGRWFRARCALDLVHAFLATRLVTTALAIVLLAAIGSSLG